MFRKLGFIAMLASTVFLLAACVDNSGAGIPKVDITVSVDDEARALLPDAVAQSGVLRVGTNATYPPNEFKDADGNPVGWDIDIMDAVAAKLGVTNDYTLAQFDNIIPNVMGGTYDVGVSSFFDNPDRQKSVDMVDYYQAGTAWVQKDSQPHVDPDNACGLTIAVQSSTTQALYDLPARSDKCVAQGKADIKVLQFDSQDDATSAVFLGRASAFAADSPYAEYGVTKSKGALIFAGDTYDEVYYALAVKKGNPLAGALQAAVQSLIDDGTYLKILTHWGVDSGAIEKAVINGAQK